MGVQQQIASSDCVSTSELSPCSLRKQRWEKAEKVAERLLAKFQPTIEAERRRDYVINYLQRLLKLNLDCEVFAYGSGPLKTYLHDGDIDLSVVGGRSQNLIKDIVTLLKSEAKKRSHKFVVKDVHLIGGAEVKIVKCMVQNLAVDISINQINGLSTLCFLEQVDCIIEKNHLFKRSIILIKAWCYYESRTLGAHVGLISTYGLETLVLYIFHVFHASLNGPLSVLYKFLEYFSVFDWDNYGISLMGPILLSELPYIAPERPPNSENLLLNVGFLRHCFDILSIPSKPEDVFPKKHLNIVDPLNNQNNLGRSVNQGNFLRIRSAFTYGARQLSKILMNEDKNITEELQSFFGNTLEMYGINQRFDNISDNIATLSLNNRISSTKNPLPTTITAKPKNSDDDENSYLGNCPKSVNETEKQSEVLEEVVPCAAEVVPSTDASFSKSQQLDLTGDLRAYMACLDQVRRWSYYAFGPRGMMGPPSPPILMNLVRPEHVGFNGVVCRPQFLPPDQMFLPRPPLIPNDCNQRAPMNSFSDINGPRHGYHTSVSHSTNDGTQNPQKFTAFVPVPLAVQPREEPLLQRRRNPNPNRSRQPDNIQRPRSKSGMDRVDVKSSYRLRNHEDFPPLSG